MGGTRNWIGLAEALGPAEGRYFGAGYRRVEHRFAEAPLEWGGLHWGIVQYPHAWSLGADGAARSPHLSSVDAIVLPLHLCKQIDRPLLNAEKSVSWRVRRIELRAGGRPWTELDRVPLRLSEPPGSGANTSVAVAARVGNIRVRIELSQEGMGSRGINSEGTESALNCLVDLDSGPVAGDCQVRQSMTVQSELESKHDNWSVDANFDFGSTRECLQAVPSAIDYFVLMGQLTQALIYRTYAADRASVGNLWMRAINMTFPETSVTADAFQAVTSILGDAEHKVGHRDIRSLKIHSLTSHGVAAEALVAFSFNRAAGE